MARMAWGIKIGKKTYLVVDFGNPKRMKFIKAMYKGEAIAKYLAKHKKVKLKDIHATYVG